jgi:hypothetical protein
LRQGNQRLGASRGDRDAGHQSAGHGKGNESLEIPRGSIDSEGKFKILTGLKEGVAPGWYKVTVDAAKVIDPKNPYHSASGFLMPIHYTDKEESNLAFEVVAKPPAGAYDLKLETK